MTTYVSRIFTAVSSALEFNAATLSGAMDVIVINTQDQDNNNNTNNNKATSTNTDHQDTSNTPPPPPPPPLRSTPFHVRFGKLRLLKSKEKDVSIFVNGVLTEVKMKLGSDGQAYFVRGAVSVWVDEQGNVVSEEEKMGMSLESLQLGEMYTSDVEELLSDDEFVVNSGRVVKEGGGKEGKVVIGVGGMGMEKKEMTGTTAAVVDYLSDTEFEVNKNRRLEDEVRVEKKDEKKEVREEVEETSWFSWGRFGKKTKSNTLTTTTGELTSSKSENIADATRLGVVDNRSNEQTVQTKETGPSSSTENTTSSTQGVTDVIEQNTTQIGVKIGEEGDHSSWNDSLVFQMDEDTENGNTITQGITTETSQDTTGSIIKQDLPRAHSASGIDTKLSDLSQDTKTVERPSPETGFRPVVSLITNGTKETTPSSAAQMIPSAVTTSNVSEHPDSIIGNTTLLESASVVVHGMTPAPAQLYSTSLPNELDHDFSVDMKKKDLPVGSEPNSSAISKESLRKGDVVMSLCAHLIKPRLTEAEIHHIFVLNRVDETQFFNDPDLLYNPNLLFKVHDRFMTWDVAAPAIISTLCFGKMIDVKQFEQRYSVQPEAKKKEDRSMFQSWFGFGQQTQQLEGRPLLSDEVTRSALSGPLPSKPSGGESPQGNFATMGAHSDTTLPAPKLTRKRRVYKSFRPTTEQLQSMNLKPGVNTVTFRVTSTLQGTQEVSSNIYLWNQRIKIVISDVDGTITRSDLLGHLLPRVGKDWSQAGVAGLYTRIAKNGYNMLYLTSRPIGQACSTRLYLNTVNQRGYKLPQGPIIMSPDRLVASLTREVIRRKPQEFKIAALRDIRLMFPPNANPFYAGFGNRNTDAISYRANGILPHRIFTVNSYGDLEVMNSKYEAAASYTSLRDLVESVFLDISQKEGMNAVDAFEYNDFRYWKTQLPSIDDLDIEM